MSYIEYSRPPFLIEAQYAWNVRGHLTSLTKLDRHGYHFKYLLATAWPKK